MPIRQLCFSDNMPSTTIFVEQRSIRELVFSVKEGLDNQISRTKKHSRTIFVEQRRLREPVFSDRPHSSRTGHFLRLGPRPSCQAIASTSLFLGHSMPRLPYFSDIGCLDFFVSRQGLVVPGLGLREPYFSDKGPAENYISRTKAFENLVSRPGLSFLGHISLLPGHGLRQPYFSATWPLCSAKAFDNYFSRPRLDLLGQMTLVPGHGLREPLFSDHEAFDN